MRNFSPSRIIKKTSSIFPFRCKILRKIANRNFMENKIVFRNYEKMNFVHSSTFMQGLDVLQF